MKIINLKQGEMYFGNEVSELKTLLGSCVAVVLWHPQKKLGGMSHIVLPDSRLGKGGCDPRYADCVVESFVNDVIRTHTRPEDYWVGVYGGGNMFPGLRLGEEKAVGDHNLEQVCTHLKRHGFKVANKDIGGHAYRKLSLKIETGEVALDTHTVEARG